MKKRISFQSLKNIQKREGGLLEEEALSQRTRFGKNEIVEVTGNPWLELAKETLKDPMIWFLVSIGTIFLLLGESSEAIVLFLAILPLVSMDAILHRRTQASTASLKKQLAIQVTVLRNSREVSIPSNEIVPGDLVMVKSGEFLACDGIFETTDGLLQVDESVLTGESLPMGKQATKLDFFSFVNRDEVSLDPACLGYAGTRVLTGKGCLRALFTGRSTTYGEIVASVANLPHDRTPLQKSITKLVQILVYAAGALCLFLAGVRIYQGHGWLDALLSSATLAVAAIPEEFPVVFTFFLGVGVYRLAKRKALVRRAVSVENIGRVSYICTDKTGTITVGQVQLTHVDHAAGYMKDDTLLAALAASDVSGLDPVDQAIAEAGRLAKVTPPVRSRVFAFTEDRKRESAFIFEEQTKKRFCYVKGSPEIVIARSTLPVEGKKAWLEKTSQWAREGHKVLACAKRTLSQGEFDQNVEPESGFEFCGLLAFEDPSRPEVAGAMDDCAKQGIHVLMITGDHAETAVAIAKDIRLGGENPAVVSAEENAEKFEESWLHENPGFLLKMHVVARCTPLQKLSIVRALRRSGELVAVTGDGVNDVPALKAADIGIAMGVRGTRSAKEVSSIVLADDNFRTIVGAIMEGRQLFSNLKMSFEYLLYIHIPLVVTAAFIPLMGYPLLYLPVHIVWLELIIHPTALFAFQQEASADVPKKSSSFFTTFDIVKIALLGLGLSAALAYNFISGLGEASQIDHARSKAMLFLALWSAAVTGCLTRFRSKSSAIISVATIVSTLLLLQVSIFGKALHVSALHFSDVIFTFCCVVVFGLAVRFFS